MKKRRLKRKEKKAIKNFRNMWNWIADETEKRKTKVHKDQYFTENKIHYEDLPMNCCYLCEMYYGKCSQCAVDWGDGVELVDYCEDFKSPYDLWTYSDDWKDSAIIAREIANLPLKEGVKE